MEHTNGKIPFFVSPRQICIIPVSIKYLSYAEKINEKFADYCTYIDDSSNTLNKKIRNAEKLRFNYIFVVGEQEEDNNSINIRKGNKRVGVMLIDDVLNMCKKDNLYD